jgi:type I restriction enzyme M protein
MLFLQHLVSKMRPAHEGGGRAGIVLNGSPLFTGAAESGPSKIRQWLLEEDLVDAIIALPTDMFFNTGIATYVWILDNDKQPERRGTVQLIDASGMWTKMRKGMGSKRREISIAQRDEIVGIYDAHEDGEHSKILPTSEFGYWTITVERPLLDDDGEVVRDRKGNPKPDSKKRDTENVPFTYGGNTDGDADGKDATIRRTSTPRWPRTCPRLPGSITRRPRSATRSRSLGSSTSTYHRARSTRSTRTSRRRSPRF